jgi:hypothetical protein
MNSQHPVHPASEFHTTGEPGPEMGFLQGFDNGDDPVEAYFECISQCSLDDGECVTVCTTILRDQS